MATKKKGKQTVEFQNPPIILNTASIVGPKEGKGPLGKFFDEIIDDEKWGEKSWEKAESKLMRETFSKIVIKANIPYEKIDYIIAGDLLNQCIATNFGIRETGIPFFGVYGACSTMGESLSLGSMLIDGGYADNIICITSSHFCSAEKQFRFPLEQGSQRPPSAQWTVTGSGGAIITNTGSGPGIKRVTTGKIIDMGIKDSNNMGAAMAPVAADTIFAHFNDAGLNPDYYDMVVTGDLGKIGREICEDLLITNGLNLGSRLNDCGLLIFDPEKQDAHAGGSGCGCSATVFAGFLYDQLKSGKLRKILFIPTGALLSQTSVQQNETIPCIAHAVGIEMLNK
jgi:stage V sporulation protein AD